MDASYSCPLCQARVALSESDAKREQPCPRCGQAVRFLPLLELEPSPGVDEARASATPFARPAGSIDPLANPDDEDDGIPVLNEVADASADPLPGPGEARRSQIWIGFVMLLGGVGVLLIAGQLVELRNARREFRWFEIAVAARRYDQYFNILALIHIGAFLVSALLFLIWLFKAHQNLLRLNVYGVRSSPGAVIGGFFAPFVNLVLPYLVVQEVWKASAPEHPEDATAWMAQPRNPWIGGWWFLWIASILLALWSHLLREENLELEKPHWLALAAALCKLGAGYCLIVIIGDITARQQARYAQVIALPDQPSNDDEEEFVDDEEVSENEEVVDEDAEDEEVEK
ncbi:MAG: DUF4328 domain-containing protein [Gemmataceae bacterium]|nr:DUF4328 domain-containing protein [Gemmataceae bacterium]